MSTVVFHSLQALYHAVHEAIFSLERGLGEKINIYIMYITSSIRTEKSGQAGCFYKVLLLLLLTSSKLAGIAPPVVLVET